MNIIKQRRKEQGLTLRQLGERVGYSYNYLNQIENGTRNPSPKLALKLEEVLGVEANELLLSKINKLRRELTNEFHVV